MHNIMKSKGELFFCIMLFILGFIIIVSSLQIGFGEFAKPGPGLFPFLCGLILCIQSISLNLFKQKNQEKENVFSNISVTKKFLFLIITFILWIILMPLVGWLPLTFLVTLSISKIMQLEGWVKPLLLAMLNTAFSYFLFGYWLAIDLPNGFWA